MFGSSTTATSSTRQQLIVSRFNSLKIPQSEAILAFQNIAKIKVPIRDLLWAASGYKQEFLAASSALSSESSSSTGGSSSYFDQAEKFRFQTLHVTPVVHLALTDIKTACLKLVSSTDIIYYGFSPTVSSSNVGSSSVVAVNTGGSSVPSSGSSSSGVPGVVVASSASSSGASYIRKPPYKVDVFRSMQRSHQSLSSSNRIKNEWTNELTRIINRHFDQIGIGWFNTKESKLETYKFSKLKRLLTMVKFIMEDTMRDIVIQSVNTYANILINNYLKFNENIKSIHIVNEAAVGNATQPSSYYYFLPLLPIIEQQHTQHPQQQQQALFMIELKKIDNGTAAAAAAAAVGGVTPGMLLTFRYLIDPSQYNDTILETID